MAQEENMNGPIRNFETSVGLICDAVRCAESAT